MPLSAEKLRLAKEKDGLQPWKLFGPCLSERQWGIVPLRFFHTKE